MSSWPARFPTSFSLARLLAIGIIALSGCQSPQVGLHDQLVRGSAVPPEEADAYPSRWWSKDWWPWRSWFSGNSSANSSPSSTVAPRPVQPEEVTPATAWHVLQRLRDEVERDIANGQD